MIEPCLKPLSLPIVLKPHHTDYKGLDYKDISDLVPISLPNFISCHSLSLTHSAPVTIVLTFSRSVYAFPCPEPLHLLFSVPGTDSSLIYYISSLQSQLKCHFFK